MPFSSKRISAQGGVHRSTILYRETVTRKVRNPKRGNEAWSWGKRSGLRRRPGMRTMGHRWDTSEGKKSGSPCQERLVCGYTPAERPEGPVGSCPKGDADAVQPVATSIAPRRPHGPG